MLKEFLSAVFRYAGAGYLRLVEVPHVSEDPEQCWRHLKISYWSVTDGTIILPAEFDETSEWYFNPALFRREDREGSKDNIAQAAVLWADIDVQGANPYELQPPPSIVLESSQGKYHCYWLLTEPQGVANLDYYNKKLAYALRVVDTGTWNANRLLRLPIGVNLKHKPPWQVRLEYLNAKLLYSLEDFEHLPEPPEAGSDGDGSLPDLPTVQTKDYMHRKYGNLLTVELLDLLVHQQADRSRALWRVYNECHRLQIPREDCFRLCVHSPNNKFANEKRSGEWNLWRDVCHAYDQAERFVAQAGVLGEIENIKASKIPIEDRYTKIADTIVEDMKKYGRFFKAHPHAEFYFVEAATGRVIPLEKRGPQLQSELRRKYNISIGSKVFDFVWAALQEASYFAEQTPIRQLSYYDATNNILYVNKYDGGMYEVTSTSIIPRPSGHANMVFTVGSHLEPYKFWPAGLESGTSLLDELVFSCANVEPERGASPEEIRLIFRGWLYSLFFPELFAVKPILLVHGEAGSGKTSVFKMMGHILEGRSSVPNGIPQNEREFEHILSNKTFVFLDNLDNTGHHSWLTDALSRAATGYQATKRKLYTDNLTLTFKVNAFMGLTSRTADFMRDDLADRSLPIRVSRLSEMISESDLVRRLLQHRDQLWTEVLQDLQRILQVIEREGPPTYSGTFRQADWAAFMQPVCKLYNVDLKKLIGYIQQEQVQEVVEAHPLLTAIQNWLQIDGKVGQKFGAQELYFELQTVYGGDFREEVKNPMALGRTITAYARHLNALGIKFQKWDSPSRYEFSWINENGHHE